MQTFVIQMAEFEAVAAFAATKDVRYYLNGVCLESYNGRLSIVATTGAVLGFADLGETDSNPFSVIIDIQSVNQALKLFKKKNRVFQLHIDLENNTFEFDCGVNGNLVDGRYPNWRRTVNKTPSNVPAQFDPTLFKHLEKAAKAFKVHPSKVVVIDNGEHGAAPCYIAGVETFGAIMMPVTLRDHIVQLPKVFSIL
jgi:DNA polymerase-3 subunit beta